MPLVGITSLSLAFPPAKAVWGSLMYYNKHIKWLEGFFVFHLLVSVTLLWQSSEQEERRFCGKSTSCKFVQGVFSAPWRRIKVSGGSEGRTFE